jgi:hypothetical protein
MALEHSINGRRRVKLGQSIGEGDGDVSGRRMPVSRLNQWAPLRPSRTLASCLAAAARNGSSER